MNNIPTIHIKDLVSLVKRIIIKKPVYKYILAVDRTSNKSLRNIMKAISSCVGNGKVRSTGYEKENENLTNVSQLLTNIKFTTSKVFDDIQANDEDDVTFSKRRFPWVSEVRAYSQYKLYSLVLLKTGISYVQSLWNIED